MFKILHTPGFTQKNITSTLHRARGHAPNIKHAPPIRKMPMQQSYKNQLTTIPDDFTIGAVSSDKKFAVPLNKRPIPADILSQKGYLSPPTLHTPNMQNKKKKLDISDLTPSVYNHMIYQNKPNKKPKEQTQLLDLANSMGALPPPTEDSKLAQMIGHIMRNPSYELHQRLLQIVELVNQHTVQKDLLAKIGRDMQEAMSTPPCRPDPEELVLKKRRSELREALSSIKLVPQINKLTGETERNAFEAELQKQANIRQSALAKVNLDNEARLGYSQIVNSALKGDMNALSKMLEQNMIMGKMREQLFNYNMAREEEISRNTHSRIKETIKHMRY